MADIGDDIEERTNLEEFNTPTWPFVGNVVGMSFAVFFFVVIMVILGNVYRHRSKFFNNKAVQSFFAPGTPIHMVLNLGSLISATVLCVLTISRANYTRQIAKSEFVIDLLLTLVILTGTLFHIVAHDFELSQVFSSRTMIDCMAFGSVLAQFIGPSAWISLTFLQAFSLHLGVLRLRKLLGRAWIVNEVQTMMIVLAIRGAALVFIFSCLFVALELLGNPYWVTQNKKSSKSLWHSVYFILVTIATVGFGDIAPETILGQAAVMIFVIAGVIFFSILSTEALALISRETSGLGAFSSKPGMEGHVVLCGGGVQESPITLVDFLSEFFHQDHGAFRYQVCVLVRQRLDEQFNNFMVNAKFKKLVTVLLGSPLIARDLHRAGISWPSCRAAYVLANTKASNVRREDDENILRWLGIRHANVRLPIFLSLLKPASIERAEALSNSPADIKVCIEDLRCGLLAKSCVVPGFCTLIRGLAASTSPEENDQGNEPWMQEYIDGMGQEIYVVQLGQHFWGRKYGSIIKEAYLSYRCLVIALEVHGTVVMNPSHELLVEAGARAYIIAEDRDAAQPLEGAPPYMSSSPTASSPTGKLQGSVDGHRMLQRATRPDTAENARLGARAASIIYKRGEQDVLPKNLLSTDGFVDMTRALPSESKSARGNHKSSDSNDGQVESTEHTTSMKANTTYPTHDSGSNELVRRSSLMHSPASQRSQDVGALGLDKLKELSGRPSLLQAPQSPESVNSGGSSSFQQIQRSRSHSGAVRRMPSASDKKQLAPESRPNTSTPNTNSSGNRWARLKTAVKTFGAFKAAPLPATSCFVEDPDILAEIEGHIVVTGSLSSLASFVASLRIIESSRIPIVVLHPKVNSDSKKVPFIADALKFGDVFLLRGSATRKPDILAARAQFAARFVIFPPELTDELQDPLMQDADSVFTSAAVENAISEVKGTRTHSTLVEIVHEASIKFLPDKNQWNANKSTRNSAPRANKHGQHAGDSDGRRRKSLLERFKKAVQKRIPHLVMTANALSESDAFLRHPRCASGEAFASSMVYEMLAQAFFNPHIIAITRKLMISNSRAVLSPSSLSAKSGNSLSHIDSRTTLLTDSNLVIIPLPKDLKKQAEGSWSQNQRATMLPNEKKGRRESLTSGSEPSGRRGTVTGVPPVLFQEVFERITSIGALPIALYRHPKSKIPEADSYYIYTMPPPSVVIHPGDQLYVLVRSESLKDLTEMMDLGTLSNPSLPVQPSSNLLENGLSLGLTVSVPGEMAGGTNILEDQQSELEPTTAGSLWSRRKRKGQEASNASTPLTGPSQSKQDDQAGIKAESAITAFTLDSAAKGQVDAQHNNAPREERVRSWLDSTPHAHSPESLDEEKADWSARYMNKFSNRRPGRNSEHNMDNDMFGGSGASGDKESVVERPEEGSSVVMSVLEGGKHFRRRSRQPKWMKEASTSGVSRVLEPQTVPAVGKSMDGSLSPPATPPEDLAVDNESQLPPPSPPAETIMAGNMSPPLPVIQVGSDISGWAASGIQQDLPRSKLGKHEHVDSWGDESKPVGESSLLLQLAEDELEEERDVGMHTVPKSGENSKSRTATKSLRRAAV